MKARLTDEQAKAEAQKMFREDAEKELAAFMERAGHFLSQKGEGRSPQGLEKVRELFEYSDAGSARLLEISTELRHVAYGLELSIDQYPEKAKDTLVRGSPKIEVLNLISELRNGSKALLKLAAMR